MVDREMLTAMSEMMDQKLDQKLDQKFDEKLKPVYDRLDKLDKQLENNVIPRLDKLELDMKAVRVTHLENGIIPRLNTIEKYYIDTSERYINSTNKIDEMSMNVSNLLSTVKKHSQKLNKISV